MKLCERDAIICRIEKYQMEVYIDEVATTWKYMGTVCFSLRKGA